MLALTTRAGPPLPLVIRAGAFDNQRARRSALALPVLPLRIAHRCGAPCPDFGCLFVTA